MEISIAGGHGKIALELTRLLTGRGDTVRSLIRNPDHATDVEAAGGRPVELDLETAPEDSIDEAIAGSDAVVFAAGAGPGSGAARKETVDYGAAVKLVQACERTGVRRYVMISAVSADATIEGDEVFAVYLRAKGRADAELIASGLDYVVVRPVSLTDDPPTGRVSTARHPGELASEEIPRADVALFLAEVLARPDVSDQVINLSSGETEIAEAADV